MTHDFYNAQSPIGLASSLALMRRAVSDDDLPELKRLIDLPKRMPPWSHGKEFPTGSGPTRLEMAKSPDHPMSLAVKKRNLPALALFLPSANPWIKSVALETAVEARSTEAFDLILDAIDVIPTPPEGWALATSKPNPSLKATPAEIIAIHPFGDALPLCVLQGFAHGVERLTEKMKHDPWHDADRLLAHRLLEDGIGNLPKSFSALAALLPALPLETVLKSLRRAKFERKREVAQGYRQHSRQGEEAFEALCSLAERMTLLQAVDAVPEQNLRVVKSPRI